MAISREVPDAASGSEALERAVRSAAAHWREQSPELPATREVEAHLRVLANAIRRGHLGDRAGLSPAALVLRWRLLDLLRHEFLRDWDAHRAERDPAAMLAQLSGIERIREQLDPGWGDSFMDRLVGPDGLALIVEVAHDLRSPLTSILFLSDALRQERSGEITDVQRRQLGIIYSAALRLLSTISDVIELARGGDRLTEAAPTVFSVSAILDSVRETVLPVAEQKGVALRFLPPEHDERVGFPVALSRVLLNLTSNALKFTDEGMVEIVTRAVGPDELEFSVRDTGDGIPEEALGRLFEPFRQDEERKRYRFSGSGLGLSICRALVEAMDSRLEIETRPGWGTRFFFTLKLPRPGAV